MDAKTLLRKIIPRRVVSACRLILIMQKGHGHVRQSKGFPVDGRGHYLPWLTYPLIEYLHGLDFTDKKIFEYGAGSSTLFWSKRAKAVESVELDPAWYRALLPMLPPNVVLYHEPHGHAYANKILEKDTRFDVIVIDGAERYRSATAALQRLAPGGIIILDNAEWYPRTASLLAGADLIEARFSGFAPLNAFTSTSSVFFHREFALPIHRGARDLPIGGVSIPGGTLDDGPGNSSC
jgi:hypothetical protein